MPRADDSLRTTDPLRDAPREARRTLSRAGEFELALLPTVTVLVVFSLVERLSSQRFLFASLASSAFLIYLDPEHPTNRLRTLVIAQLGAAALGWLVVLLIGNGYTAGGIAMVATIALMILTDAVHPPAVSTSLTFAFRANDERNVVLFGLAVLITALLVVLQRVGTWQLLRHRH